MLLPARGGRHRRTGAFFLQPPPFGDGMRHHGPHRAAEVAATVDRPRGIKPDSLVGGVDHGLGGNGQGFERRYRQSPVAPLVCGEGLSIGRGKGLRDAIDHASGLGWSRFRHIGFLFTG